VLRLSANGAAIPGSTQLTTAASAPSVASNGAGQAVLAWLVQGDATPGPTYALEAIRYDPSAKTWGTPQFVDVCTNCTSPGSLTTTAVRVAVNAGGTATVAYNRWPGLYGNEIWVATAAANTWTTPVAVDAETTDGFPAVAIDDTGAVSVAWVTSTDIVASSSATGASWSSPTTIISGAGGSNASPFRLYADTGGDTFLVWPVGGDAEAAERKVGTTAWTGLTTTLPGSSVMSAFADSLAFPRAGCGLPLRVSWTSLDGGLSALYAYDGR